MTEFLTKSPDVDIVEIKEKLYDRLTHVRKIDDSETFFEGLEKAMSGQTEEQFLAELLDIIERS